MRNGSPPVRRGGAGTLPDGARLVWSVAEGTRGRRWRWWLATDDGTSLAALLETDPDGRPTRLELAGAAGLLTLHPEPDERSAHGNVVSAAGVRPLVAPWGPGWRFAVEGLPWLAAVSGTGMGEGTGTPALAVDRAFAVAPVALGPLPPLDRDGLPAGLVHGPLE